MASKIPSASSRVLTSSKARSEQTATPATPLAPLFMPGATPDGPPEVVLPRLTPHVVMRCSRGPFAGRFLYLTKDTRGEVFGGSRGQKEMTMYVERAGLSPVHARVLEEKGTDKRKEDALIIVDLCSESGTWQRLRWDRPLPVLCDRRSPFSCSSDSSEAEPGELESSLGKLPSFPFINPSSRSSTPLPLGSSEGDSGLRRSYDTGQEYLKSYPRQRFLQVGDRLLRLERGDPLTPLAAFDEFLLAFELVHLKARILANLRRRGCTCTAPVQELFYRSDRAEKKLWAEGGRAGGRSKGGLEKGQLQAEGLLTHRNQSAEARRVQGTSAGDAMGGDSSSWFSCSANPRRSLAPFSTSHRRAFSLCSCSSSRSERMASLPCSLARSFSSGPLPSCTPSPSVPPDFSLPVSSLSPKSSCRASGPPISGYPVPRGTLSPLTTCGGEPMHLQPGNFVASTQSVLRGEKAGHLESCFLFQPPSPSCGSSPRSQARQARRSLSSYDTCSTDTGHRSSVLHPLSGSVLSSSSVIDPSLYSGILCREPEVVSSPNSSSRSSLASGPACGAHLCLRCEANPLEWIVRAGGSSLLLAEESPSPPIIPKTETRFSPPHPARGTSSSRSSISATASSGRKATHQVHVVLSSPICCGHPASSASTLFPSPSSACSRSLTVSSPSVDCVLGSSPSSSPANLSPEQLSRPLGAEDSLKWRLACAELPQHYLPVSEKSCPLLIFDHESGKRLGEVRWVGAYLVPEELSCSEQDDSERLDNPNSASRTHMEKTDRETARVKTTGTVREGGPSTKIETSTQDMRSGSQSPAVGVQGRYPEENACCTTSERTKSGVTAPSGASSVSQSETDGAYPSAGRVSGERSRGNLSCSVAGSTPLPCEIKGDAATRDGAGVWGSHEEAPFGVKVVATTKDLGTASASAPYPSTAGTPSVFFEAEPNHETKNFLAETEAQDAQRCADSMQGIDQRRKENEGDVFAETSVPFKGAADGPALPGRLELGQQQSHSDPTLPTSDQSCSEQDVTGARPVSFQTEGSTERSKALDVAGGGSDITVDGEEAGVSSSAVAGTTCGARNERVSKEDRKGSARRAGAVLDALDATAEAEVRGKNAVVEKEITGMQDAEPSAKQTSREVHTHCGGLSEDTGVQSHALFRSAEDYDGELSREEKKRCAAAEVEKGPRGNLLVCVEREVEQRLCTETERLGEKDRGERVTRNLSPLPREEESRRVDTAWASDGKGVLSNLSPCSSGVSQPPKESAQLVGSTAGVTEFPAAESLPGAAGVARSPVASTSPSQLVDTADRPLGPGAPPFPEGSSDETELEPVRPDLLPVDISFQHGLSTTEHLNSPRRAGQLSSPRLAGLPSPEGHLSSGQSHGQGGASVSPENEENEVTSRALSLTRPRTVPSPLAGAWVLGKKSDSGEVDELSGQGDFLAQAECLDKTNTEKCWPVNAPDSASATISSKREQYSADGSTPTAGGNTSGGTENMGTETSTHELERDGHPPRMVSPQRSNIHRHSVFSDTSDPHSESSTVSAGSGKSLERPNRAPSVGNAGPPGTNGSAWRVSRGNPTAVIDVGEQKQHGSQTGNSVTGVSGVDSADRMSSILTNSGFLGSPEHGLAPGREPQEAYSTASLKQETETETQNEKETPEEDAARSQSRQPPGIGEAESKAEGTEAARRRDHHFSFGSVLLPDSKKSVPPESCRYFSRSGVDRIGLLSTRRCLALAVAGGRALEANGERCTSPDSVGSSVFLAGRLPGSSEVDSVKGDKTVAVPAPHVGAVCGSERGSAAVSFFASATDGTDKPDSAAACDRATVASVSPEHGDQTGGSSSASLFATISRYLSLGGQRPGFWSSVTRSRGSVEEDEVPSEVSSNSRSVSSDEFSEREDGQSAGVFLDNSTAPSSGSAQVSESMSPKLRPTQTVTWLSFTPGAALTLGLSSRKQDPRHRLPVPHTASVESSFSSDFLSVSPLSGRPDRRTEEEERRPTARMRRRGGSASMAISTASSEDDLGEERTAMIRGRSGSVVRHPHGGEGAWKERRGNSLNRKVIMVEKRLGDGVRWKPGRPAKDFGRPSVAAHHDPLSGEVKESLFESALTPTASTAGTEEEFVLEDGDAPSGFITSVHGAPLDISSSDSEVRVISSSGEEGDGKDFRDVGHEKLRGDSVNQGGKKEQRGRRKTRSRHDTGRRNGRHMSGSRGNGVSSRMPLQSDKSEDEIKIAHQTPSSSSLSSSLSASPSASSSPRGRSRSAFSPVSRPGRADHPTQTAVPSAPFAGGRRTASRGHKGVRRGSPTSLPVAALSHSSSAVSSSSISPLPDSCLRDARTGLPHFVDLASDMKFHQLAIVQRATTAVRRSSSIVSAPAPVHSGGMQPVPWITAESGPFLMFAAGSLEEKELKESRDSIPLYGKRGVGDNPGDACLPPVFFSGEPQNVMESCAPAAAEAAVPISLSDLRDDNGLRRRPQRKGSSAFRSASSDLLSGSTSSRMAGCCKVQLSVSPPDLLQKNSQSRIGDSLFPIALPWDGKSSSARMVPALGRQPPPFFVPGSSLKERPSLSCPSSPVARFAVGAENAGRLTKVQTLISSPPLCGVESVCSSAKLKDSGRGVWGFQVPGRGLAVKYFGFPPGGSCMLSEAPRTGTIDGRDGVLVSDHKTAGSSLCLREKGLGQRHLRFLSSAGSRRSFSLIGVRDLRRSRGTTFPVCDSSADRLLSRSCVSLIPARSGFIGGELHENWWREVPASLSYLRGGIPVNDHAERSSSVCLTEKTFSGGVAKAAQDAQQSSAAAFSRGVSRGGSSLENPVRHQCEKQVSGSNAQCKFSSAVKPKAEIDRALETWTQTTSTPPIGHKGASVTGREVKDEVEDVVISRDKEGKEGAVLGTVIDGNAESCPRQAEGTSTEQKQTVGETRELSVVSPPAHEPQSGQVSDMGGSEAASRFNGGYFLNGFSVPFYTSSHVPDKLGAEDSVNAGFSPALCSVEPCVLGSAPAPILPGNGISSSFLKPRVKACLSETSITANPFTSFARHWVARPSGGGCLPLFFSGRLPHALDSAPSVSTDSFPRNRDTLSPPRGSSRRLLSLPSLTPTEDRSRQSSSVASTVVGEAKPKQGERQTKDGNPDRSVPVSKGEREDPEWRGSADGCMIKTERHGMEGRCEDSSLWMRREKERNCTQSDRSHLSPWQEGRIRASVVNTRIGSSFLRNRSLSIVRHLGESRVCRDIVGVGEEDQSLPFISPLHHSLRWKLSSSRALPRLENETSLMLSPPGSSYSFLSSRQHFPPSASGLVTGKISARTQGNFDSRNTGDSGKAGDDKGHSSSIRPGNKTEPQTKPADVATSACATSLTASPPSVGGISVDDETHEGSGGVTRDVVPCNPSEESLPSVPPSTGASSEGTNSSMGASVANSPATSETPAPTMRACQAAAGASTDPEDKKTGISDRRLDGVLENSEKLSFLEGTRGKRRLSGVASSDKNHPISTTVEGDVAEAVAMAPVGSEGGESRPRVVPPVKGKSSADPKKQPHRQCKRAEIKPDERTTTLERGGEGGCHGVPRGGSVLSEPSPPLVSRSSETLSRDAAAPHTCSGPLTNGPKVHACRPQRLLVAHGMTRGMRSVPSICRVGAEGKARFSESLGDGGLQKQAFADEDEKVLLYKAREYLLRHPRGDRPQIVIPHTGTPTPGRRELDADEQKTKNSFIKGQSKPAEPQKLLCTYMEGEFQLVATTRLVDSPAPSAWFRLAPGVPGRLRPGDEIRMGSLELAVLRFNTGVGSQQGFRGTMEDEEVVLQDLAVSDAFYCSFFAVHDGHGGRDCAQFVKRQLHLRFRHQLLRLCGRLELSNAVDTHVHAALAEAFLKTDDAYLASQRGLGLRTTSGCATVVVVIVGGALWTANCGDARAVLSRRGRAIQLSADHKPHRRDEMQRIVAAGGFVRCRRVLGRLAVSRAFGDSEYKGFQRWDREGIDESTWEWPSCEGATGGGEGCMDGCERMHGEGGQRRAERSRKDQNRKMSSILGHQATQKDVSVNGQATEKGTDFLYRAPLVTASPEIRKEALTEDDEFLLLACDGLFDVFTSQEAVTFIRERLATMPEAEQDPQIVVNELIREAIEERKSRDNVTAILVTFRSDVGCRRKTV